MAVRNLDDPRLQNPSFPQRLERRILSFFSPKILTIE